MAFLALEIRDGGRALAMRSSHSAQSAKRSLQLVPLLHLIWEVLGSNSQKGLNMCQVCDYIKRSTNAGNALHRLVSFPEHND